MSKTEKKLMKLNKNEFIDRHLQENEKFPELTIRLDTIDSVLLMLESAEETVLICVLKHLMEYSRKVDDNIFLLKEKNLLQLLLQKKFFCSHSNLQLRRLSLYLASLIVENINCLKELLTSELCEIVSLSLAFYLQQEDDFVCEYLSAIINKCVEDPKCAEMVLGNSSFLANCFSTIDSTTNPDVLLHSLELLYEILLVQSDEEKLEFVAAAAFPLKRLSCELSCEYFEIRKAVLRIIKLLLLDCSENNILNRDKWAGFLLEQLIKMFCESLLAEELDILVDVLAAAMQHKLMISLFFELNLFDKYLERLHDDSLDVARICKALYVFTECAKNEKYFSRLVAAQVPERLLECLLNGGDNPDFRILLGLNRLMNGFKALKTITDFYERGLLEKLLNLLSLKEVNIKTREQAANLLENLLSHAFNKTAKLVLDLKLPSILANIFAEDAATCSIDLLLSLLNIVELMAANTDSRNVLCKNSLLLTNLGMLLKNSFSSGVLVARLFRCLGCLVEEEESAVQELLMQTISCSSIKRALQSPSNQVKTAVTNFIMQTTRFPIFMESYKESCVLDELLLRRQHAFCVPTWQTAIESILSKNLTMKFCIRNSLGFTDITAGSDFMVSKRKFSDFRVFQCILKEEVTPLQPVIVVNFNRPQTPEHLIVRVPASCFTSTDLSKHGSEKEWCYCRTPGDEFLPKFLQHVNCKLELQNLASNPAKVYKSIDFDNLAKRAKVIAEVVEQALGQDLKLLDLNSTEECSNSTVERHLRDLCKELHCCFIPLGRIHSGCKFERAILFKALADQVGLPCTLQRSVDGRVLFNELPLPLETDQGNHGDKKNLSFIPWRMLRPTHIVDLMYNVGELYPLNSRQALQYLRIF